MVFWLSCPLNFKPLVSFLPLDYQTLTPGYENGPFDFIGEELINGTLNPRDMNVVVEYHVPAPGHTGIEKLAALPDGLVDITVDMHETERFIGDITQGFGK
jgi:hypothetical protein